MTTELVKSVSIENMVNQRNAVLQRLREALDMLGEAETLANQAHLGFPRLVIDNHYAVCSGSINVTGDYADRVAAEQKILHTVDAAAWQYLLSESGLRTFMDATAREKWNKQIQEGDIPALTLDNVQATFGSLYDARRDMFERGVLACFRRLSWDYKTNQPFKFGKRIIVSWLFSYGAPNHRVTDELDDLVRVFSVLDGQPEPDHRHGVNMLISKARLARTADAENAYFHVKWFKKGTGHVAFKRLDLVDKLNAILHKYYPNAIAHDRR